MVLSHHSPTGCEMVPLLHLCIPIGAKKMVRVVLAIAAITTAVIAEQSDQLCLDGLHFF